MSAATAPTLTEMLAARCDLQPQMRRAGSNLDVAAEFMLPRHHPAPQHARVDPQRVAHRVEAECVTTTRAGSDPTLGVDEQQAFARISRHDSLLVDVDRVGQQSEHQALLAGQAMAAGNVVILAGKNLVEADEVLDRSIKTQLEAFRHLQNPLGRLCPRERIRNAPERTLIGPR